MRHATTTNYDTRGVSAVDESDDATQNLDKIDRQVDPDLRPSSAQVLTDHEVEARAERDGSLEYAHEEKGAMLVAVENERPPNFNRWIRSG